ncbi:MAG: cadherin-like beta sandwich domain-containing protein, partial [Verrucomicrobia bacterium]|nr:cadherin-like beta sandwich domain-containing protein [Verrucomicrobiota bacterium]
MSVIPTVTDPDATVTVNGVTLASGTTSPPISLAPGNMTLTITVTAQDGTSTSYTVTVWEDSGLVTASYTSATMVPVTATGYVAAGNTVDFTLNFAPTAGTHLTVVNNTGMGFIQGVFANLAQGQTVNLTYGGVTYSFVANYFGGTGNDLVLHWANSRLLAWGSNATGELGDASKTPNSLPVAVTSTGVLAGKLVVATAAGYGHSLALCADGTVAAWGYNSFGELGNGSNTDSSVPVPVNMGGALAGKTVISVAAGYGHSLALCADGTIATWGYNYYGLLGNGTNTDSNVPVLVNREGVLAGKTVIAVAAGTFHNLALCADGTVAAWGYNSSGQLGNGTTTSSSTPVVVRTTGVLSGKTVRAIAGGNSFSLALCTDGTAAAWGYNSAGQLGNNSSTSSNVPVAVDTTGVLAGKTIIGLAAGASHSLALCADGTVTAWGSNYYGQLGNKSTTNRSVPVLVDRTGVLGNKLVTAIAAGDQYSHAVCADGSMASWGYNNNGQLGNGTTTDATAPVSVSTSTLRSGERIVAGRAGSAAWHTLAVVAAVPPPMATTLAATGVLDTAVTLNGSVNAQAASTTVSFEYGLTTSYGASVSATPALATGVTTAAASAVVGGLLAGSTYHYRIVATSGGGTVTGGDLTFTTTTFASLTSLSLSSGTLLPSFTSINSSYVASVPYGTSSIRITPVCLNPSSSVSVNGIAVASGSESNALNLAVGNNLITTMVTAADGSNTQTYTVSVTRLPQTFTFNSATDVPVTVSDFLATGKPASFALNYPPLPGARLTVVKNTGRNPIQGTFDNLTQGQVVHLTYGGVTYAMVANYFGGTGNDLELLWANTRLLAWGDNTNGQLANNSIASSSVAVPVAMTGALAGKTVVSIATGSSNCLALCADGTLAAWGLNSNGQLGNDNTIQSRIPVPVDQSGVLAGKTVIAIAAGGAQGLALCTDGTLATWGYNYDGSLGNNSPLQSNVPVLVNQTGVLAA